MRRDDPHKGAGGPATDLLAGLEQDYRWAIQMGFFTDSEEGWSDWVKGYVERLQQEGYGQFLPLFANKR